MRSFGKLFWQIVIFLFCASIFTSKSGLSIFGVLLLGLAPFVVDWKEFGKNKILVSCVFLYPLAAIISLISIGGLASAARVLYAWPWPLLVIPAFAVLKSPQDWGVGLWGLVAGLFVGCSRALYRFFAEFQGVLTSQVRITGFWDIGRWGVFLAVACIVLFCVYMAPSKKDRMKKGGLFFLFALSSVCLVLSNTRAAWLAFIVSFVVFCFLPPRRLKYLFSLLALVVVLLLSNEGLRSRFFSVIEVSKDATGRITSTDNSNAGRLHMWKVALDFYKEQPWFGTGFESTEKPLRAFIEKQSPEYLEKYTRVEFSYRDQHSSYLAILVQMGTIFFVIFWAFLGLIFIRSLRGARRGSEREKILFLVLLSHLVIFVFYGSFSSYEMAVLFPFLVLLEEPNRAAAS